MILYPDSQSTLVLPAGQVLTLVNPSGSTGSAVRLARVPGGGDSQSTTAIAGANLTFGPYADVERFLIICTAGTVTYSTATPDPSLGATDAELISAMASTITNGDTTHVPTGDVVYDALALKAPLASPSFTGAVVIGGTIQVPEKTPVNAVASSKLLTVGTAPAEAATVSIGGTVYKFRAAIGSGAKAAKTLTVSGAITDGETVTIGTVVYTFKNALSAGPTVANEILVELTAEAEIDNLVAAATGGAGIGTKYSTGTVAHTTCDVTKGSASEVVATAKAIGFAGNTIPIDENAALAAWAGGATFLSGGVDAQAANDVLIGTVEESIDNLVLAITAGAGVGVKYGTGTVANSLVTAVKASPTTMTATNLIKGVVGNSTAIAETLADGSWAAAATFLSGGVDGTVGLANETCADASYLYHCVAANTISGANWRKISLGTAY